MGVVPGGRAGARTAFCLDIGADPLSRGAPCAVWRIEPVQPKEIEPGVTVYETPVGTIQMKRRYSADGNTWFLVEHPLKTEEDYKVWMWIEEHTTHRVVLDGPKAAQAEYADGLAIGMLVPRGKSAFQAMVETLIGTEELAYALADFPDTVRALWQSMVRTNLEAVRLAMDSGYQYFLTWEDSSTQNYSPSMYDEFIGSEIGEWCRILDAHGKRYMQHACGHVRELVGRMKRHGAWGVESISPEPTGNVSIREARRIVGPDFGIIGGIEPTEFLNRSEAELVPYVEETIEAGGARYILANSDSCPVGVTVDKFRIVAETARRFVPRR